MSLPNHIALNQMLLQLLPDQFCTLGTQADQPDTAIREGLDCGDADVIVGAMGAHLLFGERKQHDAAHALPPRFAAASASRALEYR